MATVKDDQELDEDSQIEEDQDIQNNYDDIQVEGFEGSCRAVIKPRGAGIQRTITLDAMSRYYELPIAQAAKQLGVGVTVLKKCCRKFGILRWPYRKLKSMDKLIESVEQKWCQRHPDDQEKLTEAVTDLRKQKMFMQYHPSLDMESRTKKLRQANFKQEYKWRQTNKRSNSSNESDQLQMQLSQPQTQQSSQILPDNSQQIPNYQQYLQQQQQQVFAQKPPLQKSRDGLQNKAMQNYPSQNFNQQLFQNKQSKMFKPGQGAIGSQTSNQFPYQFQPSAAQQIKMPFISQALSKMKPQNFGNFNEKIDQNQVNTKQVIKAGSADFRQSLFEPCKEPIFQENFKTPFDNRVFNNSSKTEFQAFKRNNNVSLPNKNTQVSALHNSNDQKLRKGSVNVRNDLKQSKTISQEEKENLGYPDNVCKGQRQKRHKKCEGLALQNNCQAENLTNPNDTLSQNTLSYGDLDKFNENMMNNTNHLMGSYSADAIPKTRDNRSIRQDRRASILQHTSPSKQLQQGKMGQRIVDKNILDKENIPNFLGNAFQFNNGSKRKFETIKDQQNHSAFQDLTELNLRFRLRE